MSRYFCHDHPGVLVLQTRVLDTRPGAVVLEQSPYHPVSYTHLTLPTIYSV